MKFRYIIIKTSANNLRRLLQLLAKLELWRHGYPSLLSMTGELNSRAIACLNFETNVVYYWHYHYIIIYDCIIIIVDEMIAEVDIDGDGRIDFEGKFTTINSYG